MIPKFIRKIVLDQEYVRTLPRFTKEEMAAWPDPNGEIHVSAFTATATTKLRYAVVRHSDQKAWCGPWKFDGERFSSVPKNWHLYDDRESAESAIKWSTWNFKVTVEEFEEL